METNSMEKKENLLDKIAAILDIGKDSGLDDAFMEKAGALLESVAAEMRISLLQAALFSFVFDSSFLNQQNWTVDGDASLFLTLKCSKVKYLYYLNEIDVLVKMNYVSRTLVNGQFTTYKMPKNIIMALRKGMPIMPANNKDLNVHTFFSVLQDIFRSRFNNEILRGDLFDSLNALLEDNPKLDFVKTALSCDLNELDRNLLLYFCARKTNRKHGAFGLESELVNLDSILNCFCDNPNDFETVTAQLIDPLQEGCHALQKSGLVKSANDNGMASTEEFDLSSKGEQKLLSEILKKKKIDDRVFIKAAGLKEKAMFYNLEEGAKIEKLVSLLEPARFKRVIQSLESRGLRKGFACLFSGAPGTGKTETVYQIARRTGRDLLKVNIAQIKSCWVGESEKNIKEVFSRYRNTVKGMKIAPILFFNEADAVIGKRRELDDNSRAVDQMENTVQNIILQEMENLNGILIATTNLTKNLDKAFERRFLYKIEFGKPGLETRRALWQSMLPELSKNDAELLASRFDFSGGQIENILRKRQVDLVLEGMEPSLEALIAYCKDESMVKETGLRIGFTG
jgi:hypothetical protein